MHSITFLIARMITWAFGNSNGEVVLPVLCGPAKGLRLGIRLDRGETAFVTGSYKKPVTRVICNLCEPGSVAWNAGTHIGFYTALLARKVGPRGIVVAFEPDSYNVRRTANNVWLNGLDNVTLVQKALGAPSGLVSFCDSGDGTARLATADADETRNAFGAPASTLTVECVSPDQAFERDHLPAPSFIKMDIEGAEAGALLHMDAVVRRSRPRLLVELHNPEGECSLLQFARAHNYELQDLAGRKLLPDSPLPLAVLCLPLRDPSET